MYSTHNEGKSVVTERFIRTLKNKTFNHMTAINTITQFTVQKNETNWRYIWFLCWIQWRFEWEPKFKVADHVRILKYKNIFTKGYTANWSEEVFVINKIKNTVPWKYVISDLNGEPVTWSFYEKELENTSLEKFRIEEVIKRKGYKLYVKWKGYDSCFNSWIDKKRHYIKISQYFPKSFRNFKGNINVKVDLSNYATKPDIKNISHLDTSSFALKSNLARLKTEADKLDID